MHNRFFSIIPCFFMTMLAAGLLLVTVFAIDLSFVHAVATWTVTTTADDAASGTCSTTCTLRDALNSAQNGDTIQFQNGLSGTITLGSAGRLLIATNVTINGPGATNLAIDGNNANAVNIFFVASGVSASISGLTIQHGNAGYGAGIYINNGTLTVSNSAIMNNTAYMGGGGIYNNGGTLIVNSSTLSGNSAPAYNFHAGEYIGGYGGGVENFGGTLTISNSTLSGNSAPYGGGIYNDGTTLTISNSTLSGNSAYFISAASYGGDGGGIYNDFGTLNPFSNLIAKNTAALGDPDVYSVSSITSLGYNLIGNGTSGRIIAATGDQIGTGANPIDPKLDVLANNGGSTQTIALFANSPAIGHGNCAGNNSVTPNAPSVTTDQRGIGRGNPCDAGAYEGSITPPIDTIGIYRGGTFYLRLHNSTGFADIVVSYNPATKPYPVVGDWTGANFDTIGVFDQNSGNFYLRNTNTPGAPDEAFTLGNANDTPLAGRWISSAAHAGAGIFRPTNGLIYLRNTLTTGFADYTMTLGLPGDYGVAGDWTGKGFDSPGVYRPSVTNYYLSNQVTNGVVFADIAFTYGTSGDLPVVGDWIGQGHDGAGLFRPTNGFTYMKNSLSTGFADNSFFYGAAGDIPVAGHWQLIYPPIAPSPAGSPLIPKTAIPAPNSNGGNAPGDNQIGG